MAVQEYPYREDLGGVLRPTVTFTVWYGGHSWREDALIDTGSPASLFSREIADLLEIDPTNSIERGSFRVVGGQHVAFKVPLRLALDPPDQMSWNSFGWFFYAYEDWGPPSVGAVFGSEGFFHHWAVNFVLRHNYFTVQSLDD
jgi:hypothetical protein